MTFHHIISEEDLTQVCPYCGKKPDPEDFSSEFDETNFHYKELKCSCGKRLSIKMKFMGSGHDSWNKKLRDLDCMVEEEEEG